MTTDPLVSLLVEALNLTHPRFAAAGGLAYTPAGADEPPAARKARERFFLLELYHEFRRLWDKALPASPRRRARGTHVPRSWSATLVVSHARGQRSARGGRASASRAAASRQGHGLQVEAGRGLHQQGDVGVVELVEL